jgi:formylglycine-generating enzyme required for sulfatase activity
MHEMASGESLFKGDSAPAVMTQHLIKGPQIPERYPQGYPDGLGELLKAGLAREADERMELRTFLETLQRLGTSTEDNHFHQRSTKEQNSFIKEQSEPEAGQVRKIELGDGIHMEFVYVPAGEFWMGADESDKEANKVEKPKHKVYLDAYWIGNKS